MNPTSETEISEALLVLVPNDGTTIGNQKLRTKLGWDKARYFEVRDKLVEMGVLGIGRGYGGAVFRRNATALPKAPMAASAPSKSKYKREKDLYGPVERYLREEWVKSQRFVNALVQITAHQGKRKTGGQWTRPDITVVAVETYAYIPGKFIHIITFEIKPAGAWEIAGVYETASHSRFANKSYLLIHTPPGKEIPDEAIQRLQDECKRFDVGLATFKDPEDSGTYEFKVEANKRNNPDPFEMDQFISQQMTRQNSQKISTLK